MTDEDELLRYDKMVENALRGVVQHSIDEVIEHFGEFSAMPGDHHFYITFLTDYPEVSIPDYLRDRYPGEMTIVLQYQFSDLRIENENLCVTLSFNNVPEKLVVPLASITIFADPSVNFALQFQPMDEGEMDELGFSLDEGDEDGGPDDDGPSNGGGNGGASGGDKKGEVVSLDQFRKK